MPLKWWQVLIAGVIAAATMDVLSALALRFRWIAPLSPPCGPLVRVGRARAPGRPTNSPSPALTFGLCTNVFPWLLMFPAMGYGFFANGPQGTRLFASSLVSHGFFGLGLGIGVRIMWLT